MKKGGARPGITARRPSGASEGTAPDDKARLLDARTAQSRGLRCVKNSPVSASMCSG